jgi:hypothetical protein
MIAAISTTDVLLVQLRNGGRRPFVPWNPGRLPVWI